MNTPKTQDIMHVGDVVSARTSRIDEIKLFPPGRLLTIEDVAELRLTEEEVSRIVQKPR